MTIHKLLTGTVLGGALTAFSTVSAIGATPYAASYQDMDRITLTGDIAGTAGDTFLLDFGEGLITVEMDDWDSFNEVNQLPEQGKVTVYGRIDDDWYEARTIEADSVFIHDRNTYHYASDADEEAYYSSYVTYPTVVPDGTWLSFAGKITDIDGDEFTLESAGYEMQVDTDFLTYDPLDDVGFQQLDKGDWVRVSGELDVGYFEDHEIQAKFITTLLKDTGKQTQSN